ncbi:hypothetical protein EJ04DRAFT_594435 [Polyplosphaeria fusca]|uniref:Uncharacterized protein n=1 Tax=Polyplosphaeria fusca TaxID=682080 RepID=A0A9P4QJF6_9PLEO|nr:hypothetical protein EJ04DRAFT_594435 [Polyplosphaeria fusca]
MDDSDYDSDIAFELEESARQLTAFEQPRAYELGEIQRLRKHWTRFAKNSPTLQRENLLRPPPTVPQIQAYLKWRVRKGKGRLDSKVNINTLKKEFLQLERAVRYEENHTYSRRDRHVIVKYISRLPGLEGVSTRQRSKPVALFADVSDIIYFMLCCDEYVWIHPREMIQTI